MAEHAVALDYNESLDIRLPDGQVVNVLLDCREPGEQFPELDIRLPGPLAVNCFAASFRPARRLAGAGNGHILIAEQIVIPIEVLDDRAIPTPTAAPEAGRAVVSSEWRDRLVFDFEVSDDSPVVVGTWVTVRAIVSLIVDGHSWPDILRMHPELTTDDVRAALAYAVAEAEQVA